MLRGTSGLVYFTGGGKKTTPMPRLARSLRQHSTVIITTTKMAISEAEQKISCWRKYYPSIFSPAFLSRMKTCSKHTELCCCFRI